MDKIVKSLAITGAIVTVVGVGYAIVRLGRDDAEESDRTEKSAVPPPGQSSSLVLIPVRKHPLARKLINRSTFDKQGTVRESPAALLAQARKFDPRITMDELTGARLAASEHASGSDAELACIVDTEVHRAARKNITMYKSLTHQGTFGKQGRHRPASTRRDPRYRHLLAARAVLSGGLRGIALGATRFFDPVAMEGMHRKYRAWIDGGRQGKRPAVVSCDALTLLEAWSFDLGRGPSGNRCPPNRAKRGRHTFAWVGPIAGVDPSRLFLMKPMKLGDEHTRRYQEARAALRRGLKPLDAVGPTS